MLCIHYTDTPLTDWEPLAIAMGNTQHSKPLGGLWASPVDSVYGWADWCLSQDFRLERLAVGVPLEVSLNRAIVINSRDDLGKLDWIGEYPNWESMVGRGIDVIYMTSEGLLATKDSLYGWDCESMVIMNLRALTPSSCWC